MGVRSFSLNHALDDNEGRNDNLNILTKDLDGVNQTFGETPHHLVDRAHLLIDAITILQDTLRMNLRATLMPLFGTNISNP
jgi:hypothetical protein